MFFVVFVSLLWLSYVVQRHSTGPFRVAHNVRTYISRYRFTRNSTAILYSTRRVTVNDGDSFLFIAVLLCFAVAAAAHVVGGASALVTLFVCYVYWCFLTLHTDGELG
jgi:hypothetical protein